VLELLDGFGVNLGIAGRLDKSSNGLLKELLVLVLWHGITP
jgi:hypothetical protein